MVERHEAAFELLVAHEQLAEAVEPAMTHFNDPAPRLLFGVSPLAVGFLASIDDMVDVAVSGDDFQCGFATVPGIGAQVLAAPQAWRWPFDHDGLQHGIELGDVMRVGPGHDDRQRDATTVHQQVTFAAFFSPDQSDSGRPLLAPGAL